jgi:hypothetical protein
MVPIFAAYDRDLYQHIIPNHLADLQIYPSQILSFLKMGGFTVHITGHQWKAVAADEAHEMCINKDLKRAISYPTESYLNKTSLFLNCRIKAYKNLMRELFPEKTTSETTSSDSSVNDMSTEGKHKEENINVIIAKAVNHQLLPTELQSDRGLINIFTGQVATAEQTHDLLNFYKIGEDATSQYIRYFLLNMPSSSKTTIHRKKLLTMTSSVKKIKKISHKNKESQQVIQCLRRQISWSIHTGQPFQPEQEQYSIYPRALADEHGIPHKSSKSSWTNKLKSRYESDSLKVLFSEMNCVPEVVIIDAMFIINTKPLRSMKTVAEYAKFLFTRFMTNHFSSGSKEVHVIFDKASDSQFNPKKFEHTRRDIKITRHEHKQFEPHGQVSYQWRDILDCRECKHSLITAIGLFFFTERKIYFRRSADTSASRVFFYIKHLMANQIRFSTTA